MKKFKLTIVGLILCALCLIPTAYASATSKEIYYPHGIEDYVDLSTLKCFDINENDIYYATSGGKFFGYNKLSKKTTEIATEVGNVYNVNVAGEYIFVLNATNTKIFNLDTSEFKDVTAYTPATYGNAIVRYFNNKYYYLYVQSNGVNSTLMLDICDSTLTKQNSYSYVLTGSSFILDMTEDYIFAKNTTGNTLYMFKQISDTVTDLTPIKDSSNNSYFTIVGITASEKVKTIAVVGDHILISADSVIDADFNENGISSFKYTDLKDGTTTISYSADIMVVKNSNVYVFNEGNANINEFSFDASTNPSILSFKKSIIASKGNENGRFKNVSSVVFKAGTLYVSDNGNDRIQVVNKNEIFSYKTYGKKSSEVVTDKTNQMYYVLTNASNSYLYKNAETTPLATINNDIVISIDINIDGTIYMLSKTKIYTYNGSLSNKNIVDTVANNLTDDSKIRINVNYTNINNPVSSLAQNANILVSGGDTIYKVSTNQSISYYAQIDSFQLDANIKDFNTNYHNNIIALLDNGNLIRSAYKADAENIKTLSGFSEHNCFDAVSYTHLTLPTTFHV